VAKTFFGMLFLGPVYKGMNIFSFPIDIQLVAEGAINVLALPVESLRTWLGVPTRALTSGCNSHPEAGRRSQQCFLC
jgi:ribose/xylose/arabinose/galactoside ABC-type transport system permease subunit